MSMNARMGNALSWLAFVACFTVGYSCWSRSGWQEKWKSCQNQVSRLGLSPSVGKFLHEHAMKFEPDEVVIGGSRVECYHRKKFAKYMTHALRYSVQLANKKDKMKMLPNQKIACLNSYNKHKTVSSQIETPVPPAGPNETSPLRQCGCNSDCHYCCVLLGVGGTDKCFQMVCKAGPGVCAP
eukprot:gb/GEZJ01001805.1/.p1 GENE.gb/GEZJ01001805.1/~~gb/GEZJ01001805.1/.p1  ORF type:complete len:182 (-),score=11.39 gb/GEZJ01001805.1/:872-1417(-)